MNRGLKPSPRPFSGWARKDVTNLDPMNRGLKPAPFRAEARADPSYKPRPDE